jgi:hypothetical protein
MTSEVDNLVQRVAKLERQNRQLKMIGLGVALGMATFLLMGAAKTPKTVEAEKIVILDRHGRARITIGTPAFAGAAISKPNRSFRPTGVKSGPISTSRRRLGFLSRLATASKFEPCLERDHPRRTVASESDAEQSSRWRCGVG